MTGPIYIPAYLDFHPDAIIRGSWEVLVLYWFVSSISKKVTRKRQPSLERILYLLYMAFAFTFILFAYPKEAWFGPLSRRFVPDELWVSQWGAVITVAGVAFAIWARWHIGRNWSAEVTIKKDHQLIRTGPYERIRHPIYTGILLALLGTVIAVGEYRALVCFALTTAGFVFKAKREEEFLAVEFGAAFEEHKRHTGFFLPRFS
jgi:protein-S-isoprenylcysteine O-methyltransferase Ste14